jgi:hypothetical protein
MKSQNYIGLTPHNDLWGIYSDDMPPSYGRIVAGTINHGR